MSKWLEDRIDKLPPKKRFEVIKAITGGEHTDHEMLIPEEVSDRPILKKPKSNSHWGYQLISSYSSCNKKINDVKVVEEFIRVLVKDLKMKPIGEPIVVKVDDAHEEGRGVSAVQIITTSTITFHGDNEDWCLYLDVFSCAPYDPKTVFKLVEKYFSPKYRGYKWLYRDAGRWPNGTSK